MDLRMWGFQIYVLLGALLLLMVGSVLGVFVLSVLRGFIWHFRQQHSRQKYRQQTRRADGKMYPPVFGGVCDHCGSVSKKIYHPTTGPRLCSSCYEKFWPQAEKSAASEAETPKQNNMKIADQ